MEHGPMKRALRGLWPRVDPYPIVSVLRRLAQADAPGVRALFEEACGLEPAAAATHLMRPIAVFDGLPASEAKTVWHALDALVRAGGDPSEIFLVVVAALAQSRDRAVAARLLRRAALRGWRVSADDLPPSDHPDVRSVQRLARLGAQDPALVVALGKAYAQQRNANLSPAIALLEEALLSDARDEARDALVGLLAADEDALAAWAALLPILLGQLRSEAHGRTAASMIGQVRYAAGARGIEGVRGVDGAVLALGEALVGPAAGEAAAALAILGELGADLAGVRGALERALAHPESSVRAACSAALSRWLVQIGEELPLPPGQSRRRVHAANDDALAGSRPSRCPACGATDARVVYRWDDGAQFYASGLTESFCPGCGIYATVTYQNPG